jgi:prophage maintenance system killer protein
MSKKLQNQIIIYESDDGQSRVEVRFEGETAWLTQAQLVELFQSSKANISEHIKNIFKEGELDRDSVVRKFRTTASDGKKYEVEHYNLDLIISLGYRIKSRIATKFRIWATKTLKQHLLQGYTINKKRIGENYEKFMRAVADVKVILPAGNKIKNEDILELISAFADTWFSLDAYDKDCFPQKGVSKKQVEFTAEELSEALKELKKDLIKKKEATEIFGQERSGDSIKGIVGSIFQSIFGKDAYPSTEEKAAHLLYFIVKNHPFIDGNKRSGAFAFVWFLRKTGLLRASITPEALTALTLLLAESNSKDKDKMIGLTLLLLNGRYK